jgi:predicted dehydrogenase/threonine dehydrogenase-like Zn-dependent dehydrogenase
LKQVVLRNGQPLVAEAPAPSPAPGRVLVANGASVISSGTERASLSDGGGSLAMRAVRNPNLVALTLRHAREHGVRETVELVRNAVSDDTVLGYACAGLVLDTGGLADFASGQAVACAGAGSANHAEFVSVPGNLVAAVPDGVPLRDAAFTTLGAIAMQGVRRASASLGERVVVVGLGLLGLLTLQILRAAGCVVVGVEPDSHRRGLALELGAQLALSPEEASERVREWSAGAGADVAIVTAASASSAIINEAIAMVRRKGRVVPVGDVGLALERGPLYQREADVLISTSYGPGRYDPLYEDAGVDYPLAYVRWTENRNMVEFLRLLANGQVTVEPIVGLELTVERAGEAYDALRGTPPPLAVVLRYPVAEQAQQRGRPAAETVRVPSGRRGRSGAGEAQVGVGVIGPGSFVRAMHLPNIRADAGARVVAVAARRGTAATDVARAMGGDIDAMTDWQQLVRDPKVDMVLIGTRHDSHAELAAVSLRAGKAVFVEKPLGLSREQIDEVWQAGGGDAARLVIGFNRTLAPLSLRMEHELSQVEGPRQVVIRVNAPLPAEHWLNDPEQGGGRILGEACHFFDYANWLCGTPLFVSGAAARESGGLRTVQSASVTIAYDAGSVATVHYSGLGAPSLPKERIEVLAGGRAWVLDDFQRLTSFTGDRSHTEDKGHGDKGHAALMARALAACRGEAEFKPGLRAAYMAQSVALCALEAIGSGCTRAVVAAAEQA